MSNFITRLSRNPLLGVGMPGQTLVDPNADPRQNLERYVFPQDRQNFAATQKQAQQLTASIPKPKPAPVTPAASEMPDYISIIRKQAMAQVLPQTTKLVKPF